MWLSWVILYCSSSTGQLEGRWYRVAEGDTLWAISATFGVPIEDIAELNGIVDPMELHPGRHVFIPAGALSFSNRSLDAPAAAASSDRSFPRWSWPLCGTVSSQFGARWGRHHDGLDIVAATAITVRTVASGRVVFSGWQRGYGRIVIVRHEGGVFTIYAHNRANLVSQGDSVEVGQKIALVGSSGHATGPHLHFEIRNGVKAVDPILYLRSSCQ